MACVVVAVGIGLGVGGEPRPRLGISTAEAETVVPESVVAAERRREGRDQRKEAGKGPKGLGRASVRGGRQRPKTRLVVPEGRVGVTRRGPQ